MAQLEHPKKARKGPDKNLWRIGLQTVQDIEENQFTGAVIT